MKNNTSVVVLAVLLAIGFGFTACEQPSESFDTCTISYYDYESETEKSVKVRSGVEYTLPVPKKDGYEFFGYALSKYESYRSSEYGLIPATDAQGKSSGISTFDKDITLYQVLIKPRYITIKFAGDNTENCGDITGIVNDETGDLFFIPVLPEMPTKEGHVFTGLWHASEQAYFYMNEWWCHVYLNFLNEAKGKDEITVYPKYSINQYQLILVPGKDGAIQNVSISWNEPVDHSQYAAWFYQREDEEGCYKVSYFSAEPDSTVKFEEGITGPMTLYAVWEAVAYFIKMDPGYGGAVKKVKIPLNGFVDHNESAAMFEEREDEEAYYKVSYFSAETGSTVKFEEEITSLITLHAVWEPLGYFVKIDPGSGGAVKTVKIPSGERIEDYAGGLFAPKKEGGQYYGVSFTEISGSSIKYDQEISSAVTLYTFYDELLPKIEFESDLLDTRTVTDEDIALYFYGWGVVRFSNKIIIPETRTKPLALVIEDCKGTPLSSIESKGNAEIIICFAGTNAVSNGILVNGKLTIYASGSLTVNGSYDSGVGISSSNLTILNWGEETLDTFTVNGGRGSTGSSGSRGSSGTALNNASGSNGGNGGRGSTGGTAIYSSGALIIDLTISESFTVIGGKGGAGGGGGTGGSAYFPSAGSAGRGGAGGPGGNGGIGINGNPISSINIKGGTVSIKGGEGGDGGSNGDNGYNGAGLPPLGGIEGVGSGAKGADGQARVGG
jgi:hypothetical protein